MRASKLVSAGVAVLAGSGVLGMAPATAQANSATSPTWTKQLPANSPPALGSDTDLMAYDAATGNVVLFDGNSNVNGQLGVTWTWDGTTWTQQHPATSPPIRSGGQDNPAMAYDAATGNVVLFGGLSSNGASDGTWTWNGTTWTQQHPATSPPARFNELMAYDAATGNVVLFGGESLGALSDTWTWNGTTWTRQHPAAHPVTLPGRAIAYDAATGEVVLFGAGNFDRQTWTWDGTTWTRQHPAAHPSARSDAAMAYDAATGNVVLFGGIGGRTDQLLSDTWTWDGTTWTREHPATRPPARRLAAMAYDAAASNVVLFGGFSSRGYLNNTWTWG
jgi:hypothetical protein